MVLRRVDGVTGLREISEEDAFSRCDKIYASYGGRARDARFVLNSVGVKPVKENGVIDRAGSYPSTAVGGDTDAISGSARDMACGLVD